MTGRAARLVPVVAARCAADQGRLAACLVEQRALRTEAEAMMDRFRAAPPGGDAADMALTARWQQALRSAAARLYAQAAAMEPEADRLRAALALSLGREEAVSALVAAEHAAMRQRQERRAEDAVPDRGARQRGRQG